MERGKCLCKRRLLVQELIAQNGEIVVRPNRQFRPGEEADTHLTEKRIVFGEVSVSYPTQASHDGNEAVMPHHARLRNLTYAAPLRVDITVQDVTISDAGEELDASDIQSVGVFIGNLPIMLKSAFCHLSREGIQDLDPATHGECQYDQGGYFIINGAEKVVIAQVRLTTRSIRPPPKPHIPSPLPACRRA